MKIFDLKIWLSPERLFIPLGVLALHLTKFPFTSG